MVFVVVKKWAWHDSCTHKGWSFYALHVKGRCACVFLSSCPVVRRKGMGWGRGVALKLSVVKYLKWNWTPYYTTILEPCRDVVLGK